MIGKKNIHICSLGGTIAMAASTDGAGVHPALSSADLIAAVPELQSFANCSAISLDIVASANLTFQHAARIIDYANSAIREGAEGIVVTQGTDTLEEMSFIVSLAWNGNIPIIFTGAMRNPSSEGADGSANLLSAVQVACRVDNGVFVVMNDEIHDPKYIQKCHTSALSAFKSDGALVGSIDKGNISITNVVKHAPLIKRARLSNPSRIAIIYPAFDDDLWQLEAAIKANFDGYVVASFGGGHVSEVWADTLRLLACKKPVLLASRVTNGRILTSTYGYKGSEIDLIQSGLIPVGRLSAAKARICLALIESHEIDAVAKWFIKNF